MHEKTGLNLYNNTGKEKKRGSDSVVEQKPHIPSENESQETTQDATKYVDYTTIADRLRMVIRSYFCNPNCVKPVYGVLTFSLSLKTWLIKGHTLENK